MATIEVEIAQRRYAVACRNGEEDHLRSVAAIVDRKAREAAEALGSLGEARQLLFASLLLADEIKEHEAGARPGGVAQLDLPPPAPDPALAEALERLAGRVEMLAERLEQEAPTP